MAYLELDTESRQLIETVCTQQQATVIQHWCNGAGWKTIATTMGIDESTVRAHFKAGMKRLHPVLEARQRERKASAA